MKGALNDRFLLAVLSLMLLAVITFGYFILEDQGADFAPGQDLTEQQKTEAISIAMNDPVLKNELSNAAYISNVSYHVKGVIDPAPAYEEEPSGRRLRQLPAVEVILGDENSSGQNIYVFVDLGGIRSYT